MIPVRVEDPQQHRCHPFRNGYDVFIRRSIESANDLVTEEVVRLKWLDFEMLRRLSQVSYHLREEIGSIFWSNVSIDVLNNFHHVSAFLNERPAIWTRVKKLQISLGCWPSPMTRDFSTDMTVFYETVSHHMVIDELCLELHPLESTAQQIIAVGKHHQTWIEAFKKINVKKLKLEVNLARPWENIQSHLGPSDDEEFYRLEKVSGEMEPLMEAVLRPTSMQTPEVTAMDDYLKTREL